MFNHSIRVPRLYKIASKIAKEVGEGKGSIKQLVYESKHSNIKALYALLVHTFEKTDDIEKLLKKSKLLIKEPRLDPWLAKILITELLWGKQRLAGKSKPIQTILAYHQILKAHLSDIADDGFQTEQVHKPRYVRVNTLKITVEEAVEAFKEEGWILKRSPNSYVDFLNAVSNLDPEEFMIDLHIPYLLIFPPKTEFYRHKAYKNGSIILQDKASCLPVHILNPQPGSTVLDMCAAPGMKTTHCAAVMEDKGKIYAVEVGKKRYETLNKIVESSGATCVKTINEDVLKLETKEYKDVEYILVDPSCSGSGITDRVEIGQQKIDQDKNRLEKLAGFQIKVLRTALFQFPNVKRVVYSTCSVYPEENEDVVRQVLETSFYFKLVPAEKFLDNQWQSFGSAEFADIGKYCLYARPDIDLTSGFFVAVFERLEEGETNPFVNQQYLAEKMNKQEKKKSKKEVKEETEEEFGDVGRKKIKNEHGEDKNQRENGKVKSEKKLQIKEETTDGEVVIKKEKNKKRKKILEEAVVEQDDKPQNVSKKKKNKNNTNVDAESLNSQLLQPENKDQNGKMETSNGTDSVKVEYDSDEQNEVTKKKKKKNRTKTDDSLEVIVQEQNEKKKKEKKKHKIEIENLNSPAFESAEEEQNNKSKKKNKTSKNDPSGAVEQDNEEVSKKKKKKKNTREDFSEDKVSDETEYKTEEENVIGKHKKKNGFKEETKESELVELDDAELQTSDVSEHHRKKKKRKSVAPNESIEAVTAVKIAESDETEDLLKSKKKKVKHN